MCLRAHHSALTAPLAGKTPLPRALVVAVADNSPELVGEGEGRFQEF